MQLTLDVGNTQIFGGLFSDGKIVFRFRKANVTGTSSDEIGLFLRAILRENGYDPGKVTQIGCASVVPSVNHSLASACLKYFGMRPSFLRGSNATRITIQGPDSHTVGADRVASAVGAVTLFPGKNLFIVDFGTATTLDAVTAQGEYLGGGIAPGLKISIQALESGTAQLPVVEIVSPQRACGNTTVGGIQSGIYYGQLGAAKELADRYAKECFSGVKPLKIGTGGFSRLFEREGFFDHILPDLVLVGIHEELATS